MGFNVGMTEARADQLLEKAVQAGGKRDYHAAIDILLELLSEYDKNPEAYLYLGRAYHSLEERGKAIQAFRAYLERGGNPGPGYFFLGRSYLSIGFARQAAFCLAKSLEAVPDSAQALGLLGYAQLKLRRCAKAVECLQRAIELSPQDARLYKGYLNALLVSGIRKLNSGEAAIAEQMFSFVVANGLDAPHARLYHAQALCALGRWVDALEEYDVVATLEPYDPAVRMKRAIVLAAAGQGKLAAQEWEALKKDIPGLPGAAPVPANMNAYTALTELQRGEYRKAANAAVAGLRQDPKQPMLHALAGEAYRNLGFHEKAANHLRRALEQDRDNPDLRSALVMVLWSQGEYQEARRELNALARSGGDKSIVDYYGLLYQAKTAEPDIAMVPKLLKAIEKHGADPELMESLADIAFKLGRLELAMPWYEQLLELDPTREEDRLAYIACREELGPPEALEEAYIGYLELYPDNISIRREYADKLLAIGRWDEAAREYEAIVPYQNYNPRLMRVIAFCLRKAKSYREAAILYRELALKRPDRADDAKNLIFCLVKMGRKEQAAQLMEAASKHFPKDPECPLYLGWIYFKLGRIEKASAAYRKAIDMSPKSWQGHEGLAAIYEKQGMGEMANRYRVAAAKLKGGPAVKKAVKKSVKKA
jgi:tetratricopeptide (TPR) repeat protein